MGIVLSVILVCTGSMFTVATAPSGATVDLNALGLILLVLGAVGAVISLYFWDTWGGLHIGGERSFRRRSRS